MDVEQFGREVGQRLRRARMNRLMSLADVEKAPGSKWTAAAVGTYERAERALKVEDLAGLAAFYRLPTKYLLPPETPELEGGEQCQVIRTSSGC